jgi:hypothetical protein
MTNVYGFVIPHKAFGLHVMPLRMTNDKQGAPTMEMAILRHEGCDSLGRADWTRQGPGSVALLQADPCVGRCAHLTSCSDGTRTTKRERLVGPPSTGIEY